MTTEPTTDDLDDDDLEDEDDLDEETEAMERAMGRLSKRIRKAMLRAHCLILGEVEGQMWASNSYWLMRAAGLGPYLVRYNVPRVPAIWSVEDGRPRRPRDADAPIPDLTKLYRDAVEGELVNLTRHELAGCAAFVVRTTTRCDVLQRPDGTDVLVDSKYLGLVDPFNGGDLRQSAADPNAPVVAYVDAEPFGLVMPVRSL